jgi:hypothetical protein
MDVTAPAERARLRVADAGDVETILAIKRRLPMRRAVDGDVRAGGFLLGSDAEGYARAIRRGRVWLLEVDRSVVGFAATLGDAALRTSELWALRDAVTWLPGVDLAALLAGRLGYFDQLAVLPSVVARWMGAALALRAVTDLFEIDGAQVVLTTTVVAPVVNRAALPYLARVGAVRIGALEEQHDEVGAITSAVYRIDRETCRAGLERVRRAAGRATAALLEATR